MNDPMKMGGVDLRLKFSGDSLGDLYELTGVLLPDTRRLKRMVGW